LKNGIAMAQHLKWLLTCFEQMSGMRINYHKSDLMVINIPSDELNLFAQCSAAKLINSLLNTWVFLYTL
jgi:hypothetical protein